MQQIVIPFLTFIIGCFVGMLATACSMASEAKKIRDKQTEIIVKEQHLKRIEEQLKHDVNYTKGKEDE
jgi:hypothetical protein